MIWWRKSLVQIFSILLLISLVGSALATGANVAFSSANLKSKLSQSKLYEHFIDNAIKEGQKSAGSNDQSNESGAVSLSNPNVQQAAKTAFSPQLLQQSVNTFLDSNYAWLQGKTGQPEFVIDLTAAKLSFAQQVGKYAQAHLAGLPVCTNAQLADTPDPANIDPLAAICRPAQLSPEMAGAKVTQNIVTSDNFLGQPLITEQGLNISDQGTQSQPYYEKLSKAPEAYQLGRKLPIILSFLALLSSLGIVLVAPLRRRGVRRISSVLFVAATILVAVKFISDFGLNKLEHKVFNSSSTLLQQPLVDFAHRLQNQIVAINLYFGIAYLLLALIIFTYLFKTRTSTNKPNSHGTSADAAETQSTDSPPQTDANTIRLIPRHHPSATDITSPRPKPSKGKLFKNKK